MDTRDMKFKSPDTAIPVAVNKFADVGPGEWWFVHHPEGFLIECATEPRAKQIAYEINAGRSSMQGAAAIVPEEVRSRLARERESQIAQPYAEPPNVG